MPSFVHTKVDPARLKNSADNVIDGAIREAELAFAAIETALNNTLRPAWKGVAANSFFAQCNVDKAQFLHLMQTFRTCNEELKQASSIFDSADNRAREQVNRL